MTYRILSLDGGGSWALLQIMALQKLYGPDAAGHDVLRDFDLVAANSAGSITLGGLATNKTLSELLRSFYMNEKQRSLVFPRLRFSLRPRVLLNWILRRFWGIGEKYSTRRKFQAIRDILGEEYAGCRLADLPGKIADKESSLEFLIATFDYDRRRARFFRSNLHCLAGSRNPPDATLAEAIHASTTAPVNYFDFPAICEVSPSLKHARFWDGAIAGLNNPVLAAVTEVLANGHDAAHIQVLSLGTGTVHLPLLHEEERRHRIIDLALADAGDDPDIVMDLKELATSIVDDPPDTATFIAHVVLARATPDKVPLELAKRVIRMSPVIRPILDGNQWKPLPGLAVDKQGVPLKGSPDKLASADLKAFATLADLELDAIKTSEVNLIHRLGELWIGGKALNQPIRRSADFDYIIGHRHFQDALDAWRALSGRPNDEGLAKSATQALA
jgi:uncharacterized protein